MRGQLNAIFSGRGYSPVWELLADNDQLVGVCHPDAVNALDVRPPWSNGTYCANRDDQIPYPGITYIENYLNLTAGLAVNLRFTQYLHARLGLSLGHDQSHYISSEDPGRSTEPNGKVDARDPAQLNPMYRSLIDTPGRRMKLQESTIFDVFFSLAAEI